MPQLDLATFFSQYLWLLVFYLGFYLVLVNTFLPQMARILKVRAAMIRSTHAEAGTGHTALAATREASTVAALKGSQAALTSGFSSLGEWVTSARDSLKDPAATMRYTSLVQENARLQALVHKDVRALLPLAAHASLEAHPAKSTTLHTFHTKCVLAAAKRRA